MPKKKKRKKGFLNPQTLFKFVRIGALAAPAIARMMEARSNEYKIKAAIMDYTGYNLDTKDWKWDRLVKGWSPYLAAVLVTYGIPKLSGMIRRL